jgi:hypothetical protein
MFEAFGGEGRLPAEEGASYAMGEVMLLGDGLKGDQRFPWLGHDINP